MAHPLIVILDSDRDYLELLRELLREEGYEVLTMKEHAEEVSMSDLSDEDRVLLGRLVHSAQDLARRGTSTAVTTWIAQLSDHERMLLLAWMARHRNNWRRAPIDPGRP